MQLKPGSVLELAVNNGLAYVQAAFRHRARPGEGLSYGWFFRVLVGQYERRPDQDHLCELINCPMQFCCFLQDPASLSLVGKYPLPSEAGKFPIFKQFGGVSPNPEGIWNLWNGTEERIAFRLPRIALTFPNREIIDSILLRQRIEQSWTHATDVPRACLSSQDHVFEFDQYPLTSEFLSNPQPYGDVFAFLRSRGLIETVDSVSGVAIDGPEFWENDVGRTWLKSLPVIDGWSAILNLLVDYRSHHIRNADASARAYAAVGVVAAAACDRELDKYVQVPANWGPVPLQLHREAFVVVGQIGLRSGLREAMQIAGIHDRWQELLSQRQLKLTQLRPK